LFAIFSISRNYQVVEVFLVRRREDGEAFLVKRREDGGETMTPKGPDD
jgi:hypothetical protein